LYLVLLYLCYYKIMVYSPFYSEQPETP
jgi:hypothetical protein